MTVKNDAKPQKTLVELHAEAKNSFKTKQQAVLATTGTTGLASFYDIINGARKLNPAEKRSIAEIYGVNETEIDWQDEKILPESGTKA